MRISEISVEYLWEREREREGEMVFAKIKDKPEIVHIHLSLHIMINWQYKQIIRTLKGYMRDGFAKIKDQNVWIIKYSHLLSIWRVWYWLQDMGGERYSTIW